MKEGEIRQNKATRQWVIFAPARGKRPHDFRQPRKESAEKPVYDKTCPFCPGNEEDLPPIELEIPGREGKPWQTRVVMNKFPALMPEGSNDRRRQGIYLRMDGYGRHEVIIEDPRHNEQIARMSPGDVERVIETYHRRYTNLMQRHESMMILIFRNHGVRAGTSLIHPHSQLIVTGMVPEHIRWREETAQRYFDDWGRCVHCDIIAFESQDLSRVVAENPSFLAFIPFAADVPFEIWILPKKHQANFGAISDREKSDLASILQNLLSRLYRKLNDPHYNYIINTSARYRTDEPQLHWYLQIRPRLTTQAGFEIGSGISINPSVPEEDAAFLNEPE